MSLTDLLLQARTKKAEEFLFVVGSEPKIRLSSGWSTLRPSPGLATEWSLLQQSLLSSQQQMTLDKSGWVQGETSFNSLRMGFSFFQKDATMKAVLKMNLDGAEQEIVLPPSLIDNCKRMRGLVVLSGPGESGQVWALQKILQSMSEEKSFVGLIYSPKAFPQVREEKSCFVYHNGTFQTPEEEEVLMAGVDMVVFSDFADDQTFEKALALAERGFFVIYSMKAPSITNALQRCLSALESTGTEYGAARLAEMLTLSAGQYQMSGMQGENVFAHEVLVVKPEVRKLVTSRSFSEIETLLTRSAENSGILTLNQSLLQHLVRRRIDLKTAFETSRDPDNLDILLKKVGI